MKALLFTLHGVGNQREESHRKRGVDLVKALEEFDPALQGKIILKPIYYIDILQNRQERIWKEMRAATADFGSKNSFRFARKLWLKVREFMAYNFSDATIYEHQANSPNSVYRQTMDRLERDILAGWAQLEPAERNYVRVIVLADSLGGHVISNYLWDMQTRVRYLWDEAEGDRQEIEDDKFKDMSSEEIRQFSLQSLDLLITTACNIPLFVSGLKHIQGVVNDRLGYRFRWINYYDLDDLLGWPLQPLGMFFNLGPRSEGKSYAELVEDRQLNVGKGFFGRLMIGRTPASHRDYWETPAFIAALAQELSKK